MKHHDRSKNNSTISFFVCLSILVAVASVLSSCNAIIQFPMPTSSNIKPIQTTQNLATPELVMVSPTTTLIEESSPTPTFEIYNSPTLEITPTPKIPENPGSFEGIGQIASVEQNPANGKWYGIDTLGRAVIVQSESGEWVNYQRPLKVANSEEYKVIIPDKFKKELNQENVKRLIGDSNDLIEGQTEPITTFEGVFKQEPEETLPFGLVLRENLSSGNKTFWLSGYVMGVFAGGLNEHFLAFNIPLKYETQLVALLLQDQSTSFIGGLFTTDGSNDLDSLEWTPTSYRDIIDSFSSSNLAGQQLVLGLQISYNYDKWSARMQENENGLKLMMSSLSKNTAINLSNCMGGSLTRIIAPKNIFYGLR